MDTYLNVLLRSIIESATEFLPVSSTGHLFLFSSFFPFENIGENSADFEDLFDIFIQGGAILSVLALYYKFLWSQFSSAIQYLTKKNEDSSGYNFCISILLGVIPVMVLGFLSKNFLNTIKSRPDLLLILGFSWVIGGIIMIWVEKRFANSNSVETETYKSPDFKKSAIIGLFQCIALIPGVSRSASTIISARFLGISKKDAAEYSFFLALPVLLAASLYKLYKHKDILVGDSEKIMILLTGFVLSFIFCLFIIKWFIAFVKKYTFVAFGYYRIVLGLLVIGYFLYK